MPGIKLNPGVAVIDRLENVDSRMREPCQDVQGRAYLEWLVTDLPDIGRGANLNWSKAHFDILPRFVVGELPLRP